MTYPGYDNPQYLYDEWVAAVLEARQAHRDKVESEEGWANGIPAAHRYWWAAQNCAMGYGGKLRYGLDGKPRDLSGLNRWRRSPTV